MNSQNQRLETIKPVVVSSETQPQTAAVPQHSFEIKTRQKNARPSCARLSISRRNQGSGINDRYQVRESDAEDSSATWLSRLLSGWMFSLLLHCLLLLWLGSFITSIKNEGPLTLQFSTVNDVSDEMSIDISPLKMESVFEQEAGGGVLDPEVVEPDSVETLVDELQPVIPTSMTQPILEDLTFDAAPDRNLFQPVNMGTVGLDEGSAVLKNIGQGKSDSVKFFGLESSGNKFVFVIDCSGSMGGERRYQRAVFELTRSMEMLKTSHRFLVILYNSETYPMLGMTEQNIRLIPATRTNKKRVKNWLDEQQPDALTMPMLAMKTSLSLRPSSIYFLSDGEFHDPTIPMLHRVNVDDSSTGSKKIPINTITLGSTGIGAPMMKHIANTSGGSFRWVQ